MIGRNYKAEGIVLKRVNFGEKDKLITVFTKNFGKLIVLAKGIRAIYSKKAPHLELFTHVSFFVARGKNIDIVTEAYTLETFPNLRKKLEKVAYAYNIVEVLDRLCAEHQEHRNIYELLLETLKHIDNNSDGNIKIIIDEFILKTLWDLGFLPRGRILTGNDLQRFLEEVMEKNLKSKVLLTKVTSTI